MKRTVIAVIASLLILSPAFAADDALAIMQKNDALPEGETVIQKSELVVIKSGRSEKKEFSSMSKRSGRKKRGRISFSFPTKMEFLSWDVPGEDNQQWIKLSSGKVRKVASSEKSKPWMNSHFAYDDIAESYIEDSQYKLLGEEQVNGVLCYKIEAVKVNGQKVYSKKEVFIGKEDYQAYRVNFYENGLHTKTLTMSDFQTASGITSPRCLTMERTDGKGKSVLTIKGITYNSPVSDNKLTREGF